VSVVTGIALPVELCHGDAPFFSILQHKPITCLSPRLSFSMFFFTTLRFVFTDFLCCSVVVALCV